MTLAEMVAQYRAQNQAQPQMQMPAPQPVQQPIQQQVRNVPPPSLEQRFSGLSQMIPQYGFGMGRNWF